MREEIDEIDQREGAGALFGEGDPDHGRRPARPETARETPRCRAPARSAPASRSLARREPLLIDAARSDMRALYGAHMVRDAAVGELAWRVTHFASFSASSALACACA